MILPAGLLVLAIIGSMFLTVTLNPALDKTLWVERNIPLDTLRAMRALDLAGGKGVNVARVLLRFGAPARAFMPLAGYPGAQLAALARAEGMEVAGVEVSGQTRTAITIQDSETGRYWHYLEPGPELSDLELEQLRAGYVAALAGCHTVTISGSLPSERAAPLLPWMIRTAQERGLRVALDAFGRVNGPALTAGPWLAKPNLHEWELTWGETLDTEAQRWLALEQLAGWGVQVAVLSLGGAGALALADGVRYRILPPQVVEVNDLGGGDSMVAGICWAAHQGYNLRECLAWGAACGAANVEVWDPGGIERARVEQLVPEVQVLEE